MQWKSFLAASLFLLPFCGACGCGQPAGQVPPGPPKYGRVRVVCPYFLGLHTIGHDVVKAYGRSWERQTEGEIMLLPYETSLTDRPDADLWLIPPMQLPHWAAANQLQPLPETIPAANDYRWQSLLTLYREKLVVWDRKRYALPVLGESLVCCYRGDWLADPKHQAAYEARYHRKLAPPATWDEYADIAEYFSLHASSEPTFSLPPSGSHLDETEREFYTIAANYACRAVSEGEALQDERTLFSFQYDSVTGEPRIATAGFVRALELMIRLRRFRLPKVMTFPANAFLNGNAVFCLVEAKQLTGFQQQPALKDRFAVCRMPGANGYYSVDAANQWMPHDDNRVPYLGDGGWLGVVPKNAAAPDAAFSLLAYLSDPAVSKQIVIDPQVGGGPTRQEHLDASTRWESFGLDGPRTAALKDSLRQSLEHPGLKNPAVCLRIPEEASHRAVLQDELKAALHGEKTPEQALRDAAAAWRKLDEQQGLAAHRAAYRMSLGLLPKE